MSCINSLRGGVVAACLLASPLEAQITTGTIAGQVVVAGRGEPIPGVRALVAGTSITSVTDSLGRFVLRGVSVGIRRVEFRRIGYAAVVQPDIAVSAGRAAELRVELQRVVTALSEVTVRPSYFPSRASSQTPVSTQSLSAEEIRRTPGVQEDVIRAVSVLPGVSVTNVVSNELVVRGGAPAENLFLVDNVETTSINHFATQGSTGGVVSLFPVALVSDVSLSAGGFGVRYGDRVSSATTVTLREGAREQSSRLLTLSATGASAIAEGPIGANTSYIAGVRRSYLDLLFKLAGLPFIPSYSDFTAKLVHRPSTRDRLSLFTVGARDRVTFDNSTGDNRYDNARVLGPTQDRVLAGASWQHTIPRGSISTTLGYSYAAFTAAQRDSGGVSATPSPIFSASAIERETSLRTDVSYSVKPWLTAEVGDILKVGRLEYGARLPGSIRRDQNGIERPLSVDTTFTAWRNATYAQATADVADRLRVTGGVRADVYPFLDNAVRIAPRGAVTFSVNDVTTLTLAGGRYWQAPPTAWLAGAPTNPQTLRPFRADQAVFGVQRFVRADTKVQIETYVKSYRAYPRRVFRPRAVLQPIGLDDASADIPFGLEPLASDARGTTWGVELYAQKRLSELPVYVVASLSHNRSQFSTPTSRDVLGAYDLPIQGNLLVGWRPNTKWELAARARGGSGLPTTPFDAKGALDFTRYNAGPRLAPFFVLDVRVDRRWSLRGRQQLVVYADVQNGTARRNEQFPQWDPRTARAVQPASLGVLPSLGVTWEF